LTINFFYAACWYFSVVNVVFISSVVEVVWEGEETEVKKPDKVTTKNTDSKTNAANRFVPIFLMLHAFEMNDWNLPILQWLK